MTATATAPTKRTTSSRLRADQLVVSYGEREVLHRVDFSLSEGAVTAIIGPNACGKSTLLKSLARVLVPTAGQVLFEDEPLQRIPTKQLARRIGLLPQHPLAPEGITVSDLVSRGRAPHQRFFQRWNATDTDIVAEALCATGTQQLAQRSVDELSGGQQQRVWIAMALAQRTDVLLLDEPTTYLDVPHQLEVLDLLTDLNRKRGTTIGMVLHDITLAARYADELVLMLDGRIIARGTPWEVITPQLLREGFDLDADVAPDPVSGRPLVLPRGRHHVLTDTSPALL